MSKQLVVGQFGKLTHYQYQRLAIRSRIAGSPDRASFARAGVQLRAFRQTFIA